METELNFCIEFTLSKQGMIEEISNEFNIIRICLTQLDELDSKYSTCIERVLVMPLRKLLCEKNSVLLKVCPAFKMPPLHGPWVELEGKLNMIRPPLVPTRFSEWIPLDEWLSTNVAYFDKSVSELPKHIPPYVFQVVLNKLKKDEKTELESLFKLELITLNNEPYETYCLIEDINNSQKEIAYKYLKQANYYDLNIYNFIKHLSDKRGAHIDIGHSPTIELVNRNDNNGHNLILYFAIQLIWAVKNQINELSDYWPEMDDIIKTIIK